MRTALLLAKGQNHTCCVGVRRHSLQDAVHVLQGVAVHQAPLAGAAITQVVCMLQAHLSARAAVTLQPTDVEVQVADAALSLILLVSIKALWECSAAGTLHSCNVVPASMRGDQTVSNCSCCGNHQEMEVKILLCQGRALQHMAKSGLQGEGRWVMLDKLPQRCME